MATSLAWAQAARADPPARVASLNLCTDELLLALAAPGQISSLTHLSRDRRESAYWRMAQAYPANSGTILSVAKDRPDLIVTMGGGGRDSAGLAAALGARFLELPFPARLIDVEQGIALLAKALGREHKGEAVIATIRHTVATAPKWQRRAIFIGNAGRSLSPNGAGAQWLAAAGYRQMPLAGDRFDREQLLHMPPVTLLISDYRTDQYNRSNNAPLRRARDRQVVVDGRRWTCMGPSVVPEILRLRKAAIQ